MNSSIFADEFIDFADEFINFAVQNKWIHLNVMNEFIKLLSGQSPNHEQVAQKARANPKPWACSASREGEARAHLLPRPGRTQLPWPLGYTRLPRLKCNWIKVNEFAGLLDIFYIQGSTKSNAKMMSQNIIDEFIHVSVWENVKLNRDNIKPK